jgi:hypothetical protein
LIKKIPLGTDDFKKVREDHCYLVDKTPLIEELLTRGAQITLFPRPRRFGKTLNMSMLRYFFEKTQTSNSHLFTGLAVEQNPGIMAHQGQYPVVFLTLKSAKQADWSTCYAQIQELISTEYRRHKDCLPSLTESEKQIFEAISTQKATEIQWQLSLKNLSTYLHRHHKNPPIILIDEYDAPIHAGFLKGFYDPVIDFIRTFLGEAFKGNLDLHLGVLTGVLRVAKESIFSGLNNLQVCSVLSTQYTRAFGFFGEDVQALLAHYGYGEPELQGMKSWYNGYRVGNNPEKVYNPWSVLNCVMNSCQLTPYWINTSDNLLIQEIIAKTPRAFKEDLELLLKGESLWIRFDEMLTFERVFKHPQAAAIFFLQTGYLTFETMEHGVENAQLELKIPNREILEFFQNTVTTWLEESLDIRAYEEMLKDLVRGHVESFEEILSDMLVRSMSIFDPSGDEPERFYHALVLGILVGLRKTHEVKSNRESGYGRYDVMIIPKDSSQLGVILEFKKARGNTPEAFQLAAHQAMKQIKERGYRSELKERGIGDILYLVIALKGKKALVVSERA